MVKKNIVALVQARYNSIRLKGKILKPFNGIPSIELLYKRLKKSKLINRVIIVTSKSSNNIKFINFLKHKKIPFFLGEEENVLKRYYDAAIFYKATDIIVELPIDFNILFLSNTEPVKNLKFLSSILFFIGHRS